ncbi:hypothetical protein B0J11DRAFT_534919 [Dendryphion nanum]|uniref:F-box domain-containing protein n=1 Tax=Dendryphion nanum TaxID=256645 RepID=A0A9P9IHY0_9PLEO|nr:hypothetical protein B0J11DRAFT_534919 [Dendryphion nanum]
MSPLANLPAELKLCIAESLSPIERFSLGLTCKAFWFAFSSLLAKHKELDRKYRRVSTEDDSFMAWNVLSAVLDPDNPDVAWHIEEVGLGSQRTTIYSEPYWEGAEELDASERLMEEVADKFIEAAESIEFLTVHYDSQREPAFDYHLLGEDIRMGIDAPVIVTLLFLLPRLRDLHFVDVGDFEWILNGFRQLALAYEKPNPAPNLPLQCLTNIYIGHWDTELSLDWELAYCVIRLPSLRSLVGHMIGSTDQDAPEDDIPGWEMALDGSQSSNVEEMTFLHSGLSRQAVLALASRCKNLKKFKYSNGGATVTDVVYDPRGMINALSRFCYHSLEVLCLEDDDQCNRIGEMDGEEGPPPSLHAFQELRIISCSAADIYNNSSYRTGREGPLDREDLSFNPEQKLPSSLRRLQLTFLVDALAYKAPERLINEIASAKESYFAELKQIWLCDEFGNINAKCEEKAKEMGVNCKPIPSFAADYGYDPQDW